MDGNGEWITRESRGGRASLGSGWIGGLPVFWSNPNTVHITIYPCRTTSIKAFRPCWRSGPKPVRSTGDTDRNVSLGLQSPRLR